MWGDPGPTVPGPDAAVTCHRHGHVCSAPRCRCPTGTRSPHMADPRRRDPHRQAQHIQRWTALGRRGHVHVTHKDAGMMGCIKHAQAGRPPAQMHPATQERQRITKTHTCHRRSKAPTPQTRTPQRSMQTPWRHTKAQSHEHRQSTDKQATKKTHRHTHHTNTRTCMETHTGYTSIPVHKCTQIHSRY